MRSYKEAALPPIADKSHHILMPYIGGVDDRVALSLVIQLAKNPNVTATIMHLSLTNDYDEITAAPKTASVEDAKADINTEITAQDSSFLAITQSNLSSNISGRVEFIEVLVSRKAASERVVQLASDYVGQKPRNAGDVVVVGRRHPVLSVSSRGPEQGNNLYEMQNTVGVLGEKVAMSNLKASVLVIQAAGKSLESWVNGSFTHE